MSNRGKNPNVFKREVLCKVCRVVLLMYWLLVGGLARSQSQAQEHEKSINEAVVYLNRIHDRHLIRQPWRFVVEFQTGSSPRFFTRFADEIKPLFLDFPISGISAYSFNRFKIARRLLNHRIKRLAATDELLVSRIAMVVFVQQLSDQERQRLEQMLQTEGGFWLMSALGSKDDVFSNALRWGILMGLWEGIVTHWPEFVSKQERSSPQTLLYRKTVQRWLQRLDQSVDRFLQVVENTGSLSSDGDFGLESLLEVVAHLQWQGKKLLNLQREFIQSENSRKLYSDLGGVWVYQPLVTTIAPVSYRAGLQFMGSDRRRHGDLSVNALMTDKSTQIQTPMHYFKGSENFLVFARKELALARLVSDFGLELGDSSKPAGEVFTRALNSPYSRDGISLAKFLAFGMMPNLETEDVAWDYRQAVAIEVFTEFLMRAFFGRGHFVGLGDRTQRAVESETLKLFWLNPSKVHSNEEVRNSLGREPDFIIEKDLFYQSAKAERFEIYKGVGFRKRISMKFLFLNPVEQVATLSSVLACWTRHGVGQYYSLHKVLEAFRILIGDHLETVTRQSVVSRVVRDLTPGSIRAAAKSSQWKSIFVPYISDEDLRTFLSWSSSEGSNLKLTTQGQSSSSFQDRTSLTNNFCGALGR